MPATFTRSAPPNTKPSAARWPNLAQLGVPSSHLLWVGRKIGPPAAELKFPLRWLVEDRQQARFVVQPIRAGGKHQPVAVRGNWECKSSRVLKNSGNRSLMVAALNQLD